MYRFELSLDYSISNSEMIMRWIIKEISKQDKWSHWGSDQNLFQQIAKSHIEQRFRYYKLRFNNYMTLQYLK